MTDTYERLCRVISEETGIDPERLKPETHIINELGPDPMVEMEIALGIEKEFGVDLTDDTASCGEVRELVARIEARQ